MVEQKLAIGFIPVAAGTASFLVIGLHTAGNLKMGHKPDVGTVNAHAKRIRGNDDVRMAVHEGVLSLFPLLIRHARVVSRHVQAKFGKSLMDLLHLFAGGAIHNTRLMALHQLVQPLVLVLVRIASRNAEMQVFPRKPPYNRHRVVQPQMFQNILPHAGSGRGGQSRYLRAPHRFNSPAQLQIIRTEIMPPLAQAVSLIHGNHIHVHLRQSTHEPLMAETLRSHIHQLERPVLHAGQAFPLFRKAQGAVDHGGGNPSGGKGVHLVFHQGDQRADHQADPVPAQGGKLVAQGFPSPGGHHHQHVAAFHDGSHHAVLSLPQTGKAEVLLQCLHRRPDHLELAHFLRSVCHSPFRDATPFPSFCAPESTACL